MSRPSGSSRLRELFEAALVEYEQQTGIDLAKHPFADRLQDCNSVEDITVLLREQAQDFKKFREKDKVLKPLKKVLTVLHLLSSVPGIAQHFHLVRLKELTDMQCL
jgi:STAND-like protein